MTKPRNQVPIDQEMSDEPFQPESWNRYTYVRNSPLSRFDPDGEVDIYIGGLRDNRGAPGPVKNYALDPGKGGSKALYFGHGQVKQAIAAANEFVGTEPINIIGHSYGADSAVAVAAGVEGEVDNLIGIDPVGKPLKKLVGKVGARPENVKNVVTVQGKSSSINCSDVVEALGQAVGGEPKAFKKQADTATTVEGAHHDEFDKMMNTPGEDGRSAQDILDQSYRKEDD